MGQELSDYWLFNIGELSLPVRVGMDLGLR